MSTQARGFPSGEMRASDADRDLALAELSEHFQTGRLTQVFIAALVVRLTARRR
jgi:DUF1707 SHOCT-like domain